MWFGCCGANGVKRMDKKLRLSRNNKIIAGVCGGISEYFNLDPTLVRVIWVVLTFCMLQMPIMVVIYIVCWAVMPADR